MSKTDQPILLVEDSADDVVLIRRAFRRANLLNPLQVVGDGEAAVAYLAGEGEYADRGRHPLPLFVLLDLKLPRKSGTEVLAWLRGQPDLRRTPVIVLTSSKEQADLHRAYDLGVNSYLIKPVAFDDLQELIGRLNLYWVVTNEGPEASSTS